MGAFNVIAILYLAIMLYFFVKGLIVLLTKIINKQSIKSPLTSLLMSIVMFLFIIGFCVVFFDGISGLAN